MLFVFYIFKSLNSKISISNRVKQILFAYIMLLYAFEIINNTSLNINTSFCSNLILCANSQLIQNRINRSSFTRKNAIDDLEDEVLSNFETKRKLLNSSLKNNPVSNEKEKLGVSSFYKKYSYSNNKYEVKTDTDLENFPNDENINFLQTKSQTKNKSQNKNKVRNKQLIEPIEDLKNSGVPFALEDLNAQIKDPDVSVYGLADPDARLSAIEKDTAYKVQVMLKLQDKVFKAAKPERFEGEYSYERTKMQKENGDDFVGFLGFLGESAKKYTT